MSAEWWMATAMEARILWWAIEHHGHPAFFLRALMPGDMAPLTGLGPLPRHAYTLAEEQIEEFPVRCCTCRQIPNPADLVPIERCTGERGRMHFFTQYELGVKPWPGPTSQSTCWLCSNPKEVPTEVVNGRKFCSHCANSLNKGHDL